MVVQQGRAEDVALKADVRLSDRASAFFGYRFVEGGADNDKVYTFSFFHYAVAGLSVRFDSARLRRRVAAETRRLLRGGRDSEGGRRPVSSED